MQQGYIQYHVDGTRLPFGDGEIILRRVRNRDGKHIHVYRKRVEHGEDLLCMASGAENDPVAEGARRRLRGV